MKRRCVLLSSIIVILSFALPVFAFAASGNLVKTTFRGVNYKASANISRSSSMATAHVSVVADKSLPAGHIGATSYLYKGTSVVAINTTYSSRATSAVTSSCSDAYQAATCYARGWMRIWDTSSSSYIIVDVPRTPTLARSSIKITHGSNLNGKTFGSILNCSTISDYPDLIEVITNENEMGYINKSDLLIEEPDSPEEAQITGEGKQSIKIINAYDYNEHLIGAFTLSFGNSVD